MRTSLDLCVCLLTLCGTTLGRTGPGVKVVVEEDSDAVLPCSLSTKEDITRKIFDWRKDFQKKVFMYDSGTHSNNGLTGQDQQFKGRVSHFQDQLMNGDASIKIQNTKVADSGSYRCIFPHLQSQTFIIELVVEHLSREVERWRSAAIVVAALVAVLLLVAAVMCRRCYHVDDPFASDSPLMNKLLYYLNNVKDGPDGPEEDSKDSRQQTTPSSDDTVYELSDGPDGPEEDSKDGPDGPEEDSKDGPDGPEEDSKAFL